MSTVEKNFVRIGVVQGTVDVTEKLFDETPDRKAIESEILVQTPPYKPREARYPYVQL